jgi:hypothetical protein
MPTNFLVRFRMKLQIQKNENISFKKYDEKIDNFLKQTSIDKRQPELYQRILDKMRNLSSGDIPLALSFLRYLNNK